MARESAFITGDSDLARRTSGTGRLSRITLYLNQENGQALVPSHFIVRDRSPSDEGYKNEFYMHVHVARNTYIFGSSHYTAGNLPPICFSVSDHLSPVHLCVIYPPPTYPAIKRPKIYVQECSFQPQFVRKVSCKPLQGAWLDK